MRKRFLSTGVLVVLLLLSTFLIFNGASSDVRAANSGTITGWGSDPMQGASYTLVSLSSTQSVSKLTIVFSGVGSAATVFCGVGPDNTQNYPPIVQNKYSWIPKWGFDMTHAQGTTTISLSCNTTAVLVTVQGGGSPTLTIPASATPTAIVSTATTNPIATSTQVSTATSLPATATKSVNTVPPATPTTVIPTVTKTPNTATNTSPTSTMVMGTATNTPGDGGNTCGNLGDGAVDQNGVSVDVWAPGLRIACGFPGYENGDNPMPAGTHLPAPRPFRFDSAVVSHESPFGFKVYYRQGSEAPAGYGGTNGCGDVRVILHQGGSVNGFTTQFHTYQFAADQCDAQGNHHIIDVAGRIDTGTLFLRHNPDSERPDGANRTTADTLSCDGTTTFICATVWYSFFNFALPGASNTGWSHMGFLVENPITLYDVNNPTAVHLTGQSGTTTMLRDNQFYMPAHSTASWTCLFNTVTQVNEVVSPGTAGAWTNYVDPWFSEVQRLEPSYGVDHTHNIAGIKYPN